MSSNNYLPDEILLEIISHIESWKIRERQASLARFCAVNRQWYDVAIRQLYQSPYLSGRAYELFVRTICPSVLAHIKPTSLSSLVQTLDLSTIVHQGTKSTTARLLNRTKASLTTFIAPQASFAINCWASLSKCTHLRVLDLSLVSEQINFQSLNQTIRQLHDLRHLCLPRCSSNYTEGSSTLNVRWPPRLERLALSGSVSGKFLWDILRQPEAFPPSFYALSVLHCPGLDHGSIRTLVGNLAASLTVLELRDLPAVKQGRFNGVLDWCPRLERLTIALDYIDTRFGHLPPSFSPENWREAKALQELTLLTSGKHGDPDRSFTPDDMGCLVGSLLEGRWDIPAGNVALTSILYIIAKQIDQVLQEYHQSIYPCYQRETPCSQQQCISPSKSK
ncbi:hypothetical protein T440DRAFT_437347 [Plenodomus tracheiphilus IPT5]|uniref:F-box domain-containing protein n=1 Tax=Plenodomus tracheiphilus IPT5 TaxID=1408161 RepID=A0A6A7BPV2_9PLEO|nr:hypothetical protein T440DRAFT_437347 [Plenodomus tracheiphilus IPT5]